MRIFCGYPRYYNSRLIIYFSVVIYLLYRISMGINDNWLSGTLVSGYSVLQMIWCLCSA